MSSKRPIIALDGDGVGLDYHAAYRQAWARAFGYLPAIRDPNAYWALDRFDIRRLEGDELARLRDCFDEEFWSTIPAIEGAVEASHRIHDAGNELVCVTAIHPQFEKARLKNLRNLGFPIERVVAAPHEDGIVVSPKINALRELKPLAFVDDYSPYFVGIPPEIHAALILREPNGSPNTGDLLNLAHSQHADLAGFAEWWLNR